MNFERVYKKTQMGEKEYELFGNITKTKRQVGTIVTTQTSEVQSSLSVYLREQFNKATVEIWTGTITQDMKRFDRTFFADIDVERGVHAINELFSQMMQVYNGTDAVKEISDRIVDVSNLARDEKQKPLHETPSQKGN